MKVISLWQPWASLVVIGAKKIETRHWNTKYRGPLLIHASQKTAPAKTLCNIPGAEHFKNYIRFWKDLPFGAIIGRVDLVTTTILCPPYGTSNNEGIFYNEHGARFTSEELAFGNYEAGRYGWLLANAVKFEVPIPAKGCQGFFNYDL